MCDLKKSIKTKCTNTGNGSDELFVNSIKSKCGGSDKQKLLVLVSVEIPLTKASQHLH